MKYSTKKIRIKLDIPSDSVEYYKSLQQWENEGGRPNSLRDSYPSLNLPFYPGDTIQIKDVHINVEDNEFYYVAEIENVKVTKDKNV